MLGIAANLLPLSVAIVVLEKPLVVRDAVDTLVPAVGPSVSAGFLFHISQLACRLPCGFVRALAE